MRPSKGEFAPIAVYQLAAFRKQARERALCVLKADIKEFSRHMHAGDTGQAVWDALRNAVAEHAARCLWSEVSEGDAVILVHDDPNALINVALRLSEDLFEPRAPAAPDRRRPRPGPAPWRRGRPCPYQEPIRDHAARRS